MFVTEVIKKRNYLKETLFQKRNIQETSSRVVLDEILPKLRRN